MTPLLALLALVGLGLLARELGRQGYWARLRARMEDDPAARLLQRHGLAGTDAAAVRTAVERGRKLDDPALRRAAVDLAHLSLTGPGPGGGPASAAGRAVVLAMAGWGSWVVADGVFALVFGGLADVNWFALLGAAVVLSSPVRRGLRLHRAAVLNADRPVARD